MLLEHVRNIIDLSASHALTYPAVRNNLWDWEWQEYYQNRALDAFCDALEVKNGQVAGPNGWGVDHALKAWGKVWTDGYLATRTFSLHLVKLFLMLDPVCGEADVPNCLGTHDPTIDLYTNTQTGNMVRSWQWLLYAFPILPRSQSDCDQVQ